MPETQDHLDKEASLELELKGDCVSAKIRSRAFNGIDRLVGSVGDFLSAKVEGSTEILRAKTAAQVAIIEEARKTGLGVLKSDPKLANRALENLLDKTVREQQNKDGVARAAIEDLKTNSDAGNTEGPDELAPEFLDRLEQKAALASTEAIREKWGRVLAQEVRQPGTITAKVMRIVDEISLDAAKAFEKFVESRLSDRVFRCLLNYDELFQTQMLLIEEDLIDNSNALGLKLTTTTTKRGEEELFFLQLDDRYGLLFPTSAQGGQPFEQGRVLRYGGTVTAKHGSLAIDVYRLTNAGTALASIISHDEKNVLLELARAIGNDVQVPFVEVMEIVTPGKAHPITRWTPQND